MESFTADGEIFDTISDVFKTCKVDFSKRYTQSDTNFDIELYNELNSCCIFKQAQSHSKARQLNCIDEYMYNCIRQYPFLF